MKVALYTRVSTEEQARSGLSIDTQLDNLRSWAKQNGHVVVGEYVDAGVSGKKPYTKRPELSRFMRDIENGLKVDVLLITKLDRFYRSVRLYYQAIETMEKHGVAWKAIQEDYETVTASGRFKVNIMLAVAEDEADRTSERIRVVFERKIEKGEVVNNSIPIGYKVENKRLVPDERADMIRGFFDNYRKTGSIHSCMDYLERHGIRVHANTASRMIKNTMYKGLYRGNPNFCPPIIPTNEFDAIQAQIKRRSVRKNQTGRTYLFSGLIQCGECGHAMAGIANNGQWLSYRCTNASMNHRCPNRRYVNENKLVKALLPILKQSFENYVAEFTVQKQNNPRDLEKEKATLNKRMDRLKDLYLDGLLTKGRYQEEYESITKKLMEISAVSAPPDFERTRRILSENIVEQYETLNRDEQRVFWRSIIEKIVVPQDLENDEIKIFFA